MQLLREQIEDTCKEVVITQCLLEVSWPEVSIQMCSTNTLPS